MFFKHNSDLEILQIIKKNQILPFSSAAGFLLPFGGAGPASTTSGVEITKANTSIIANKTPTFIATKYATLVMAKYTNSKCELVQIDTRFGFLFVRSPLLYTF